MDSYEIVMTSAAIDDLTELRTIQVCVVDALREKTAAGVYNAVEYGERIDPGGGGTQDVVLRHTVISFIFDSIKQISSSFRPYLLYNC